MCNKHVVKTYGFFFSKYFIKLTQKQYQKGAGLLRITLWSTYLIKRHLSVRAIIQKWRQHLKRTMEQTIKMMCKVCKMINLIIFLLCDIDTSKMNKPSQ